MIIDPYRFSTGGGSGTDVPEPGCYSELFENGLSDFAVVVGAGTGFSVVTTPYGPGMRKEMIVNGGQRTRTIPQLVSSVRKVRAYFRMNAANGASNRATSLYMEEVSGFGPTLLWFCPKDQTNGVFPNKPWIMLGNGDSYAIGSTTLTDGVWYKLDVVLTAGVNNSSATIRNASTDALISSLTYPEDIPLHNLGTVSFFGTDGTADPTKYVEYGGIVACDHL